MLCASCGQENRQGRRFCAQCGASLALVCPLCGSSAEPDERFCGECGNPLTSETSFAHTPTPAPQPALPASFAAGRYQVKRFLGEGGRKRVYLAHDEKLDRDVAIAAIKTEGLDADSLTRVRREAQSMGRLGDHPHIVTVFDIGDEDSRPYIVSQYMGGGALDGLLREAENHRLPLDRALAIGGQICQALEHAHSRGIVHRDLKPGNIWLTQEGIAKLGDFGLAVALDRSRLLAKPPEERPASAAEVRTALASIAAAPAGAVAAEPAEARPRRGPLRSPFVGREKEMATLKERLEDAISGRGLLMMVVGEPGIGKTRLADELSVYARLRGAQVLLGQCYESEGAPPYIPFVEALRQYVNSHPPEALREEMGDGASDVAKLVSEVRTAIPDLPHSPPQEPETERYRLLEAVTSFLINASGANPLLLILDDIHWADKPSLLLLEHLARRLSDSRILVVGTYRDVELDRRHPLSEVLAGLRRERLYERVLVRGLDADGVGALIRARATLLGSPETEVAGPLADAAYQQTEGNPFFIEEILFHLYEVGLIYLREGQWQIDAAAVLESIPEGVREVIGRRLSRLSVATNQALTLASVLGREFDFDVLQRLSEMEEEMLLASLEQALGAQLISEQRGAGGTSYRFSHALVQETLYGELSIARKQRFHLRAGLAIEQARAGHPEPYVGQLARHFYEGNDAVRAIDYAQKAAEAAVKVYAWEEAVRHWEAALELMEERGADDAEQARLMEQVGDATYISGIDLDKGIEYLERALAIYERTGARGKVAATHSRLGRGLVTYFGRMDLEKGPAHLEAARAILEEDAPESPGLAYVYIGLCTACLLRAEMETGMAHSRRALEIGEKLNSRPVTAMALVFTGNFLGHMGELREGLDLLDKGWAIADDDGLTFVAFLGALLSGPQHVFTRSDPGEGKRWPRLASAPILRRMLLGFLGSAHIIAGEMDEARRLGEGVSDDSGLRGALQIASGEWEAAEERLTALSQESSRTGISFGPGRAERQLGEICFRRGELDRAEEYLRAYCGVVGQGRAWALDSRLTLARVLVRMGRLKEAQDELNKCLSFLAGDEDWGGTMGHLALARGALAAAEQNWDEAESAFEEAPTIARRYGLPWDEADALHERGLMHLARDGKDDRKEALRLLDGAIAIYERLGAKKHLELVLADKLAAQGISITDIGTSIDTVAREVLVDQPDLKPHAAPDGTVTIMFSDIEGSTEMTERLGDKRWLELLREHNAIVREQVAAHAGFEVKAEGDGFMMAFQSAGKAVKCASAIQKSFAERNANAAEPILVRIGLHTGEAIKEGEDFFGKNVILAARVAGQAQGGEILVSSLLKALVDSSGDITWGEPRNVELKGLAGEHGIWPVAWK